MRLEIGRNELRIIPDVDDARDLVFIEEVLGLEQNGDWAICRRTNTYGLSSLAYLEIVRKQEEK